MRLTVLGSGTALCSERRGCPGYLIQDQGHSLVMDFGSGSVRQLTRAGVPLHKLQTLLLTHAHVDHCGDLAALLFARRNPDLTDRSHLTVAGWQGFEAYYDKLNAVHGRWITDREDKLTITTVQQFAKVSTHWQIETANMNHIPGALGFRIESPNQGVICYSGDTDVCDEIVELGRDADLLLLECSFPDELKVAGHLTPRECGEIAVASNCRTLMLSHFYPPCDRANIREQVRRVYDGELLLAEDLMCWELGT